jgi:hypothetical protein
VHPISPLPIPGVQTNCLLTVDPSSTQYSKWASLMSVIGEWRVGSKCSQCRQCSRG